MEKWVSTAPARADWGSDHAFFLFVLLFLQFNFLTVFSYFLGFPWSPKYYNSVRGGTPLNEFNCNSFRKFIILPCSLRSGASPYSLKGSFGEPAAGSTSPSASTRPREFVFVFAVRSSCACVCLFDCLFLCIPLCFFCWLFVGIRFFFFVWPLGAPSGVYFLQLGWVFYMCFAFVETLGLHCSTRGSVLGPLGYML